MTTRLSVSVDIDAPAQRTWDVVTDWERQGEWIPLTDVKVVSRSATAGATGPAGLDAEIDARTGVGVLSFLDSMVVDVWEPPYRCEVVHRGKIVTGRGFFVVDELPDQRSRFTWAEELDSTGLRSVIDRIGLPATRVMFTVALQRLARIVVAESRR